MSAEREVIGRVGGGAVLSRLTDSGRAGGYSCHLYLNVPSFTADGGRLVFVSTRGYEDGGRGRGQNLFVLDPDDGRIDRVSNVPDANMHSGWFDAQAGRHYFWRGRHLASVELASGRCEELVAEPARRRSMIGMTCDSRYAVYATSDDPPDQRGPDLSTLWRVDLTTGSRERILSAGFRISHVQCSPTDPDFVLYNWECMTPHRLPYVPVMQRMWWANLGGTAGGAFGRQRPNEGRTHEFFTSDGRFVGYHGAHHDPAGGPTDEAITSFTFGLVETATGTDAWQMLLPAASGHCQMSDDGRLICCDQAGGGHLGLIRRQGPERFVQLYQHGSSMVGQHTHPHPQFRPGRAQIVFSTDRAETGGVAGQSDIYLLELPPEIST